MDRARARRLREEIGKVLEAFGEAEGVTLEIGPGRFDGASARFKIVVTEGLAAELPEARALREATHLGVGGPGTKVVLRNVEFELVGYRPRSRKYSLLGRRTRDGQIFRLELAGVQQALGTALGAA